MAARRQSAVEVAGGYVLDYIRSKRVERDSGDQVTELALALDRAREARREAEFARAEASTRLESYIQAAIDAE